MDTRNRFRGKRWLWNTIIIAVTAIVLYNLLPALVGMPLDRWWRYKTTGSILSGSDLVYAIWSLSPSYSNEGGVELPHLILHEVYDGSHFIPGTRAHLLVIRMPGGEVRSALAYSRYIGNNREAVLHISPCGRSFIVNTSRR